MNTESNTTATTAHLLLPNYKIKKLQNKKYSQPQLMLSIMYYNSVEFLLYYFKLNNLYTIAIVNNKKNGKFQ